MQRLLDISVLIALCDPNHVAHERVALWFEETGGKAWVSCPITENGFLRIISSPSYPGLSGRVPIAAELLRGLRRHRGHHFWADDYSIANGVVNLRQIAGPKQVTDLYLLALAVQRKGKFSSLDLNIPAKLVQGGAEAYEVI